MVLGVPSIAKSNVPSIVGNVYNAKISCNVSGTATISVLPCGCAEGSRGSCTDRVHGDARDV